MPTSDDIITHKKLILIRQLYQRSVIQATNEHGHVDRILSIIGFDLSVETLLKVVISRLKPAKTRKLDINFHELIILTNSEFSSHNLPALPDTSKVVHVRSIRNDAQHNAKYPNIMDVDEAKVYVRDFLKKVIFNVWGLSFDSISLTDIIQHKRVKKFLVVAENELENGNYTNSIINAEVGFKLTLSSIKGSIVGWMPDLNALSAVDAFGRHVDSHEAVECIKKMQESMMLFMVGLDYSSYFRYESIVRSLYWADSFISRKR